MTEILSSQASVILHVKEQEPVAMTLVNGKTVLYKLTEMTRTDILSFYEADLPIKE